MLFTPVLAAAAEGGEEAAELALHVGADGALGLIWLVPLLPLLGFAATLAFARQLGEARGHLVALATSLVSFVLSVAAFLQLTGMEAADRRVLVETFDWISVGDLSVRLDLLVDPLTSIMLLIVTGVALLVHVYSVGYMHGDPLYARFFAYLNLFLFSMLVLVLGSSFLSLFLGWELVGLSSYLLIGFWFERPGYAAAAKKAFITNRVGDVAFMVAMFLIFAEFGSLDFFGENGVLNHTDGVSTNMGLAIGLLLAGGAVAKSAQIPLYVWLPDAMAGPTPVSALMHAATMVTAGVFLVARSSAIFVLSEGLLATVSMIGALTALMAALIALRQDDIKKVLAYSTVSQLGYMFIGVGSGGFVEGIFHLMTHAFFKGLLFLAAGSVMHAFLNRTNMWRMGGLKGSMPVTYWTAFIAVWAISGLPPMAGFWSKDQVLTIAFEHGFFVQWGIGLFTAALTAFYMSRWFIVTFMGDGGRHEADTHPHESPSAMTLPLMVLAVLSAVGGLVNIDHFTGPFYTYLSPAVAHYQGSVVEGANVTLLIAASIVVAAIGVVGAWLVYGREEREVDPLATSLAGLSTLFERKFFVDELYELLFVRGGTAVANAFAWFDRAVIDGAVNGVGTTAQAAARGGRRAQSGFVRAYIAAMVLGTIVVVGVLFVQVA